MTPAQTHKNCHSPKLIRDLIEANRSKQWDKANRLTHELQRAGYQIGTLANLLNFADEEKPKS